MNPRKNYSEADTLTTRALINLFIEKGDLFKFPIDTQDSEHELRVHMVIDSPFYDSSVIGVTAINESTAFKDVREAITEMSLQITEEDEGVDEADDIGEYHYHSLTAVAPDNLEAEWDIPHILAYGSLSPELEDAARGVLGNQCEYYDIRNHYVIRGENIRIEDISKLNDAIGRYPHMFEDDRRFYKSNLSTDCFI